jgi:3-hydroxybutyryl-CoA dehydrogenase
VSDLADLADCDLVIEAIAEDLTAKRELFAALDAICGERTVFASNTSAISITAIAVASVHPERCLGLHFFNPAPLMPLVEVVRAERTDEQSYAAAYELILACGKQAVRCNDTPGFIVNRLLVPALNDAVRALDEIGVDPAEIDAAMTAGAGWPMGPFRLIDMVGVDVHVHAAEALHAALGEPRMAPPARLRRMLDAGFLGRKTGRGFYDYGANG